MALGSLRHRFNFYALFGGVTPPELPITWAETTRGLSTGVPLEAATNFNITSTGTHFFSNGYRNSEQGIGRADESAIFTNILSGSSDFYTVSEAVNVFVVLAARKWMFSFASSPIPVAAK